MKLPSNTRLFTFWSQSKTHKHVFFHLKTELQHSLKHCISRQEKWRWKIICQFEKKSKCNNINQIMMLVLARTKNNFWIFFYLKEQNFLLQISRSDPQRSSSTVHFFNLTGSVCGYHDTGGCRSLSAYSLCLSNKYLTLSLHFSIRGLYRGLAFHWWRWSERFSQLNGCTRSCEVMRNENKSPSQSIQLPQWFMMFLAE